MGFQLTQKLKILKRQINEWKEVLGKVQEQESQILSKIQRLDAKEENGDLEEAEREQ